jgi:RNA-directed DNA polymerase
MNAPRPERPQTPGAVPAGATPPGDSGQEQEATLPMSQGSRLIWTQRMLQALERGNDGRKWHTLIDKVYAPANLRSALSTVTQRKTSPGIDGRSAASVARDAEAEVATLERLLREGKYEPQPVKRVWIPKPGSREKRPLGIPTIRGRIVETALRDVIEPIFEHSFAEHSYGFRPKRSAKQAVARVEALLEEGRHWVVDADIKGYFDNIPHEQLMDRVSDKISDGRVLALIEKMLKQGVMETINGWTPTEQGTPQGAVISPLLANIYLDPLDHQMAELGREMIRYADDFVILCKTQAEAEEALEHVRAWMSKAGLTLHPEKTRIVDATQRGGFEFLGWHFERGYKWPREKSQKKLKDSIRERTRRHNGHSLKVIITRVNQVVRGWGNYFQGGVRTVSPKIDGWIRGRLRSILRVRAKRHGRGRGRDHNRYPNDYFAERGLASLYQVTHPTA